MLPKQLEPTFSVCSAHAADASASLEAARDEPNSGEDQEDATTREKEVAGPTKFTLLRTPLLPLSLARVPGC